MVKVKVKYLRSVRKGVGQSSTGLESPQELEIERKKILTHFFLDFLKESVIGLRFVDLVGNLYFDNKKIIELKLLFTFNVVIYT